MNLAERSRDSVGDAARGLAKLASAALLLTACTKFQVVDFAMSSARHQRVTAESIRRVGPYQLLAGDMHCHVRPPDAPYHVSRTLDETLDLARSEGLDFVVLTPHVNGRFFVDEGKREWVARTQRELRARLATADTHDVVAIPGVEYTDYRHGHVGLGFADMERVLELAKVDAVTARPELFFEVWRAEGGVATINHPFLEALPNAPVAELHYDLSWRAFRAPVHPGMTEIAWLTAHADAMEVWNESVGHVRDRYFLDDPSYEQRQASHLLDRLAREQHRTIAAVGGSDSHGEWLRPTSWVLAKEKSAAGIRDAIRSGRTCARAPEPCTLEARGANGAWANVGGAVQSVIQPVSITRRTVEARAARPARFILNGAVVAETSTNDESATIETTGRCSTLRAEINEGSSSPIFIDCVDGP